MLKDEIAEAGRIMRSAKCNMASSTASTLGQALRSSALRAACEDHAVGDGAQVPLREMLAPRKGESLALITRMLAGTL